MAIYEWAGRGKNKTWGAIRIRQQVITRFSIFSRPAFLMAFVVDFRTLRTPADLANVIGCPSELFQDVCRSATRTEFYQTKYLEKKSRRKKHEWRTVYKADSWLADAQKALLIRFEDFVRQADRRYPHPAVHGYVKGRGVLSNASQHVGKRLLLRADVRDFFPSISRARVEAYLATLGLPPCIVECMGSLTTIKDELGQGIHTSPLLSNLICLSLDEDLTRLATQHGCGYTRYADDMTFSSDSALPTQVELESCLRRHDFELAIEKFRISKIGQAHFVTGLSVSDPIRPHVPRYFKRTLRQELYFCRKYGIVLHSICTRYRSVAKCVNSITGRIAYLRSIEPELGRRWTDEWHDCLDAAGLHPSYAWADPSKMPATHYFADESVIQVDDQTFLAVCLVEVERPWPVGQKLNDLVERIASDPFAAGKPSRLRKVGFHFVEDSEDTRTKVIELISSLPIRGFIAFDLSPEGNDVATFQGLLHILLQGRLARFKYRQCHLSVEQRSDLSVSDVREVVQRVVEDVNLPGLRLYHEPSVSLEAKGPSNCLALADYLLGVFSKVFVSSRTGAKKAGEQATKRFERVRLKIRLIGDCVTRTWHSRNRPFPIPYVVNSVPLAESTTQAEPPSGNGEPSSPSGEGGESS